MLAPSSLLLIMHAACRRSRPFICTLHSALCTLPFDASAQQESSSVRSGRARRSRFQLDALSMPVFPRCTTASPPTFRQPASASRCSNIHYYARLLHEPAPCPSRYAQPDRLSKPPCKSPMRHAMVRKVRTSPPTSDSIPLTTASTQPCSEAEGTSTLDAPRTAMLLMFTLKRPQPNGTERTVNAPKHWQTPLLQACRKFQRLTMTRSFGIGTKTSTMPRHRRSRSIALSRSGPVRRLQLLLPFVSSQSLLLA